MHARYAAIALLALLPTGFASAGTGLDIKTGLWTVTMTSDVQGSLIPAAALARMPPAQRAKVEASMKARSAQGPSSHTTQSCVTPRDLEQGAFRADDDDKDSKCVYKITSQSATTQEASMICTGEERRTGKVKFDALGREHVKGEIHMVGENGQVNVQLDAKWQGAKCGDVH
jgi:hypothetical protein